MKFFIVTALATLAASRAFALGEPVDGRPSYPERLALYATNRARMEPGKEGWAKYAPTHPLLWHDDLAQAARAHSQDMRDTPCFQHNSCDGTDTFTRIKSYWTQPFASLTENIAAGVTDGQSVVSRSWIDEVGAPPGETGHREAIFDFKGKSHYVGLGYLAGGTRYRGYWTQDFAGVNPAPAIPRLASGTHFPETVSAGEFVTLGTVYFDAGGAAPERVEAIVDGKAWPLGLARGKAAAGAYEGDVKVEGAGCHRYWFRAVVAGAASIYPDGGTLAVATTGTMACAEWTAGGVTTDPDATGGAGGGGCTLGGRGAPGSPGLLAFALLVGFLALRRRRR